MTGLKIWGWVLWIVLAYDIFALIFGIVAGSSLWWLSLISIAIMIFVIRLHRKTVKNW